MLVGSLFNASYFQHFFQGRVANGNLPNRVQKSVQLNIDPCVAQIIRRTKTAVFYPLPNVHCPRKTGALFSCSIMDLAVRRPPQSLALDGRTAKL